MAEKKEETPTPDETTPPAGDGQDPAKKPAPGGEDDKSLESATPEQLRKMVKDLRVESGTSRTKAKESGEKLTAAETKLKAMEDAKKTQEEKDAERVTALETAAAKIPGLTRYADYVKAELDAEMTRVEGLKAAQKKPYADLLDSFGADDFLGRLKAVRALRAVEGTREPVKQGNEANPADPGGGAAGKTLASQLAYSPAGMAEAQLAGLVPAAKKD